jgi:hypothetical protein
MRAILDILGNEKGLCLRKKRIKRAGFRRRYKLTGCDRNPARNRCALGARSVHFLRSDVQCPASQRAPSAQRLRAGFAQEVQSLQPVANPARLIRFFRSLCILPMHDHCTVGSLGGDLLVHVFAAGAAFGDDGVELVRLESPIADLAIDFGAGEPGFHLIE